MVEPSGEGRQRGRRAPIAEIVPRGFAPSRPLPAPLTALVGRAREREGIGALLGQDGARLVTLTGPGGVGKTRLALQVADDVRDAFADGVCFVPLAALAEAGNVAPAIAAGLGLTEPGTEDVEDRIASLVARRHLLLVLDNVEHVVGAAPVVGRLLAACAHLSVLATSRVPLRLYGEHRVAVAPLGLPTATEATTPAEVLASEAGRLFVERARATAATFALDETTAPAVAAICRRLDGLPLAIELAAARVNVLSPAVLLDRLASRLDVLHVELYDRPPRLSGLREAIAWSYDLLSGEEQRLFRELAVFAGGFTIEGAQGALGAQGAQDESPSREGAQRALPAGLLVSSPVPHPGGTRPPEPPVPPLLDSLAALVEQNLLLRFDPEPAAPRFSMLESIREFGLERLEASGAAATVRRRHALSFARLAERANVELLGPGLRRWLDRLERDHENLRVAFAWALAAGERVIAARLGTALWLFWFTRGYPAEGLEWMDRLLALGPGDDVEPGLWGRVSFVRAFFRWVVGDDEAAIDDAEAAVALGQRGDNPLTQALAWFALGLARHGRGELDGALAAFERSYDFYDAIDLDAGRAAALNQIGRTLLGRRELERAAVALDRSLALNRRLGYPRGLANVLLDLGELQATRGDWARAAAYYLESVETCAAVGDRWYLPLPLAGLAELVALRGEAAVAARLAGAIETICGTPGITSWRWARPSHGRAVLVSRRGLAAAVWEAERVTGSRLGLDEVVATARLAARALERNGRRSARGKGQGGAAEETGGLSRREREVLRLLVAGRSDREIGEALFVSHRTVQSHLARIFRKLGVHGRAEAAAEAVRHHLD